MIKKVTRHSALLFEASVLIMVMPVVSNPSNKDDIYNTPVNKKLGRKLRGEEQSVLI